MTLNKDAEFLSKLKYLLWKKWEPKANFKDKLYNQFAFIGFFLGFYILDIIFSDITS